MSETFRYFCFFRYKNVYFFRNKHTHKKTKTKTTRNVGKNETSAPTHQEPKVRLIRETIIDLVA